MRADFERLRKVLLLEGIPNRVSLVELIVDNSVKEVERGWAIEKEGTIKNLDDFEKHPWIKVEEVEYENIGTLWYSDTTFKHRNFNNSYAD